MLSESAFSDQVIYVSPLTCWCKLFHSMRLMTKFGERELMSYSNALNGHKC